MLHSFLMSSEPRPGWAFFNKLKSYWIDIFFFNYLCNFLYTQFIKLKLYDIMYRNTVNYKII